MIKISALNEESEEDSGSEEGLSNEALEQIALQQYAKALELQRKGNTTDAIQLLKDLLDTELLYKVKKPCPKENISGPLVNLKYLCYKNLGSMLSTVGEADSAIEYYAAASELDETDVTLWHRFGLVCMQVKRYEMALYAFQCGVTRNPRHWPSLDKIVTILMGINDTEQCLITIHDALKLDPDYLRGLVYRKHIYTINKHMIEYMEYLNPIYKWDTNDKTVIDEEKAKKLLKEAEQIYGEYVEQQKAESFTHIVPKLKLKEPISKLSWKAVGNSLISMHEYMTEYFFSHACFVEITLKLDESEKKLEDPIQESKECEESDTKAEENGIDSEIENNDMYDKEKPVRRRGSALSALNLWDWCKNRTSGRKKPARQDDTIYDMLRRMVPTVLIPEAESTQAKDDEIKEESVEISINRLFDETEPIKEVYFGTEHELRDVKAFVAKYTENTKDIIDLLRDYLDILSAKWKLKWPQDLTKVFIKANKCYMNHIDIPACTNDNTQELLHFVSVNLLVEEFLVNDKLIMLPDSQETHGLSTIDSIEIILTLRPHIYTSVNCLESILRQLWLKLHIHILNKSEDHALDCLYQLLHEFNAMEEHHDTYCLEIINFTYKSLINKAEISRYVKCLERNKKLSTVKSLYNRDSYEEVLSIIMDSFEHCKILAKKQEDMSLDFALQLSFILDSYWALDKVDCCFKWSLICLHEALKHYFRYTSGTTDYEKWTLTVVKILSCMEHILNTEGLSCLNSVSTKELSQGLEDLIRIIGHQVETNSSEMPFDTVSPWIIMHHILQREEDQGRGRYPNEKDRISCDEVPNPLMLLFIAHEHLGNRSWCCTSNGKLLFFILDTIVPRLRSPSLAKTLEQITQYMEQCVYCLFGHPEKKLSKFKYIEDHSATPHILEWKTAQQLYEIFRPSILPSLEVKLAGITPEIEILFQRILALLPPECDPQKYVPEMDKYIKGIEDKLPAVPPLLPYKMKDIYYILGHYHWIKDDYKQSIKFNTLDVVINNDRLESWAEISLTIALTLERLLNSCKKLNSEKEFLNPAKSAIRCFQRSLQLNPNHCRVLIKYGNFTYYYHSFCSRLLKQASESLSMEEFEALEKQKEDLLDTTTKCFSTVTSILNKSNNSDKAKDKSWLFYYMLGKVAEKKNNPPSIYLNYYMQGVRSLQEKNATYPPKINYSTPTHLSIEVLEFHYRIHASILKYIEQHENKPIPASVGKVFISCIEEWQNGPFSKKSRKENVEVESEAKLDDTQSIQAGNILKRSISDVGEEDTVEAKKLKLESAAAKVRRSASYDTERLGVKVKDSVVKDTVSTSDNKLDDTLKGDNRSEVVEENVKVNESVMGPSILDEKIEKNGNASLEPNKAADGKSKEDSSSSSSSSSDSSSSESSSDSSSDSSRDSDSSSKSSQDSKPLSEDEIMKIVSACLDALEDCASRFPPHYKAIYRLAHYHFYYTKGRDIERCRDLMLLTFTSRLGQKLGGLFSERKQSNFFNNIWKIPHDKVERAGCFAFHMNRSVLLTMEILKEIDDHKTLLDLSLHLQRVPELDKKYLRDSDREELAQQAFSLCVQSQKGQLLKFSQQEDLKTNEVERQALKSLMLDIYLAYRAQKQSSNYKQFTNLLIDAYKLLMTTPITENMNLVDLSLKYGHSLKQQANQVHIDKSQNVQKKQTPKIVESSKPTIVTTTQSKPEPKPQTSSLSKNSSSSSTAAAYKNYMPMINDAMLSQQTAAALSLSYLGNISALAEYSLQDTLKSSLPVPSHSFQAEFYRQFYRQNYPCYVPQQKKQKRASKPASIRPPVTGLTIQKPIGFSSFSTTSASTSVITAQKSTSAPLTPSMGTVLQSLPASLTANLSAFSSHSSSRNTAPQAHVSSSSNTSTSNHPKPPMPHQQVSPGKTLQEKLAEKQKSNPILAKSSRDISSSLSRLPSSLTVTKTSSKQSQVHKQEVKKSLPFKSDNRPKPISTDEIIILDDD